MKIQVLLLIFAFGLKFGSPNPTSQSDVARLESIIKDLSDKMSSINVLQYAFRVNQIDMSLRQITRDIADLKQKTSQPCNCNGQSATSSKNIDQDGPSLNTILQNINTYGNKLLPGHSTILEKISELKGLFQSGFTKVLQSLLPLNSLNQELTSLKSSLLTEISEKFDSVSSKQDNTIREVKKGQGITSSLETGILVSYKNVSKLLENQFALDDAFQWEALEALTQVLNYSQNCKASSPIPPVTSSTQSSQMQNLAPGISTLYSKLNKLEKQYNSVNSKMFTWRNNMEIHCTHRIFKSFRLCADADEFIAIYKTMEVSSARRLAKELKRKASSNAPNLSVITPSVASVEDFNVQDFLNLRGGSLTRPPKLFKRRQNVRIP